MRPHTGVGPCAVGRGWSRPGERGEVMVTTLVLVAALLLASTILLSASEQWEARRKAAAAAASMSRAAAQGEPELIRQGLPGIDPAAAQQRVAAIVQALNASDPGGGYQGRIVAIDGVQVTAEASITVDYTFPLPGFPDSVAGSAQAEAVRGDR